MFSFPMSRRRRLRPVHAHAVPKMAQVSNSSREIGRPTGVGVYSVRLRGSEAGGIVMKFAGTSLPLSDSGLKQVLDLLKTGAAEVWTVLAVETHGCGFLKDRRPLILFERHIFHNETNGAHDLTHPGISAPTSGGYVGGAAEYDRLQEAFALNPHAALDSASWGIGQVMGFNCKLAGFNSVEDMVTAMVNDEDAQLKGMANFMHSQNLHVALSKHDWSGFARDYNGPSFAKNQYD